MIQRITFYPITVILLLVFLSQSYSYSQTTQSVFVDVGIVSPLLQRNGDSDALCTVATAGMSGAQDQNGLFDCAAGPSVAAGLSIGSGLIGGPYSFIAPSIPSGMQPTNIEVVLYNFVCSSTITIDLQDEMLMLVADAVCNINIVECPESETKVSKSFSCNDPMPPSIMFGESNEFNVMADDSGVALICFTHAEIIFTFDECAPIVPIPTMGEWGLVSLGLLILIFGVRSIKQGQASLS